MNPPSEIVQTSAFAAAGAPGNGTAQTSEQPRAREALPSPADRPVEGTSVQPIFLTFSRALNQSLVANPDLVALRGRLDINRAMVGVARTYPWNPFIQAQFLPTGTPFVANTPGQPASGAGYGSYYIWVMQRFEVAHQRQFRTRGAMAGLDQTQWTIFQGELLNVAQTTRLYFAALYQKEVHELARETAELNERLATVVEQRFKANLARPGDVTTARVAARQSRRQAELTDATYHAALAALYQQLNLPTPAPFDFEDKLTEVQWYPLDGSRESVAAEELADGRPDVLAAKAGVHVADAAFGLAKAAMVPDIQAGPIYDTGDDTTHYIGVRVQMNLPIFDTGAPLARQRRAERNFQQLSYDQLKTRATLEAEAALHQYEKVRQLVVQAARVRTGPDELKEITKPGRRISSQF